MWYRHVLVRLTACVAAMIGVCSADERDHVYNTGDRVIIWASTISPRANHQETYSYFSLPFCTVSGYEPALGDMSLAESLMGLELKDLGIPLKFRENVESADICKVDLTLKTRAQFIEAAKNDYRYTWYLDDLPIYGYIGSSAAGHNGTGRDYYLFLKRNITVYYNKERIIAVDVNDVDPVRVSLRLEDEDVDELRFTYSVRWIPTLKEFDERFARYLDSKFFEHKVHSLSIFNSFLLVVFLVGVVCVILLRTVRRDYARYEKDDAILDLERDLGEENGWKQIHGDIFRSPNYLTWFSALMGTGMQLVVLMFMVILYTIAGDLYIERASILSVTVFAYVLTGVASGYISARFYAKHGGRKWVKTMLISTFLFPGFACIVSFSINWISIAYGSSRAIPFRSMVTLMSLWGFTVFPLNLIGSMFGKNLPKKPEWPCRINPIPRPIPERPWYARPIQLVMLSGILPFGSIFIEIHFILTSFWAVKIYHVYGFLMLVFIMLLIVTACVSIVSTYILLNAEDHRWHWTNFFASGSTAFYVFFYSIYYFFFKTNMHGLLQTTWYFGYTLLACAGLLVMLGSVGIFASNYFIRLLYRNIKLD